MRGRGEESGQWDQLAVGSRQSAMKSVGSGQWATV